MPTGGRRPKVFCCAQVGGFSHSGRTIAPCGSPRAKAVAFSNPWLCPGTPGWAYPGAPPSCTSSAATPRGPCEGPPLAPKPFRSPLAGAMSAPGASGAPAHRGCPSPGAPGAPGQAGCGGAWPPAAWKCAPIWALKPGKPWLLCAFTPAECAMLKASSPTPGKPMLVEAA